jgi:hypothetical protein
MRRLVDLWLALLAAYWLTRAAASSLFFGRVDRGYPALVELLAIPALQAAALAWATRQPGAVRLTLPWREGWRLRPLRGALALDVSVIAAAWLIPPASRPAWLAPSAGAGLPAWLAAIKLAGAAALLAAALSRLTFRLRDRLAVAALAATLLALAAEPWRGWLAGLPDRLSMVTPPALRWYGVYGTLTAAALLLVLRAAEALRRHSHAAAMGCEWALGLLLAAAGCAALGFVRHPLAAAAGAAATAVTSSWGRAAAILGSLSCTALLVGAALAAATAGRAAPAGPPAIARAPGGELGEEPA